MGRMYSVSFKEQAVTVAVDVFEILPAAQKPCKLWALFMSQSTDFSDAAEEIIPFSIVRGHTTSGNGAAASEIPLDGNDAAAGFVAEQLATTQASAGTAVEVFADSWNIRVPYQLILPPELRPRVQNAELLVVRFNSPPIDSIDLSATIFVEEL